ncbi:MAG: ferredoxin [Pseudonocardiaceae bacterium]
MDLEIVVTRPRCIAAKACINAAPGVFAIVDGASMLVDGAAASEEHIIAAAEACPTGAITIYRAGLKVV